jgi:cupin fold WbuC family metalloprotein
MVIDAQLLDSLTLKAQASTRLRMNMDLRDSVEDSSQRMLNALEPGTILPIHRHMNSSETVIILRGRAVQYLYNDEGHLINQVLLEAGGQTPAMQVEKGQWHRLESLEHGTVIVEFKNGIYEPIGLDDIL